MDISKIAKKSENDPYKKMIFQKKKSSLQFVKVQDSLNQTITFLGEKL